MAGDTQTDLRRWLKSILDDTGWTPSQLAREAGISHTTITRMLDAAYAGSMNASTIAKIARVTGSNISGTLAPALAPAAPAAPPGFAEPDIERARITPPVDGGLSPDQSVWTVRGHALMLAGYLPGDHVIVDMAAAARARDVVIAQIYDLAAGTARTVLRLYEPPFLVTASTPEHTTRPDLVDDERARLMGVVVRMWRERAPGG